MLVIPSFFLFSPFQKGFVRQHTRKTGTVVQAHFTKRPPGKVKEKHLKKRFYDHSGASAKKAHEELEEKKKAHQSILDAVKAHHDELTKKGPSEDEKGLSHNEKLSHLKAEIKNQQTHIENHSRKQDLIKNRYKISKKQIVRKKSKADLEKRIKGHTDEQKKAIRDIHKAYQEGKSKLEPGKTFKGKDDDHIYLETKHKDTGETHHVAIHKDGSIKDPQILHEGKFDTKDLTEHEGQKKVVAKKEPEPKKGEFSSPPISAQETFPRKATIDQFTQQAKDKGIKIDKGFTFRLGDVKNRIYRVEKQDESGNLLAYSYIKGEKQKTPVVIPGKDKKPEPQKPSKKLIVKKQEPKKTEQEKKETRSIAMKGNKNAYKGGSKEEPRKLIVKKQETETSNQKKIEDWNKNGVDSKAFKSWFGDSKVVDDKGNPKETHHMSNTIGNDGEPIVLYHGTRVGGFNEFEKDKVSKRNLFGKGFYFTEDKGIAKLYTEKGRAETDKKAEIKEVYLSIRNPYRMDDAVSNSEIKELIDHADKTEPFKWDYIFDSLEDDQIKKMIDEGNKENAFTKKLGDIEDIYLDNVMPVTVENVNMIWSYLKDSRKYEYYKNKDDKLNRQTLHNILSDENNNSKSQETYNEYLKDKGYDGLTHIDGYKKGSKYHGSDFHRVWIAFEPNQIKSTDNQGTFNPNTNNIYDNGSGKSRSEAMKGNKNAFKGGPKEEQKKMVVKKQDKAAFTKTKKQLDKAQEKLRTGKDTLVITARSKEKHPVRYKVVEADDDRLIASNHIDGRINKDYPSLNVKGALQMRDRSNIQSKAQITQMSNDLEPMFLTDSKIASDGAPIVGSDYKGKEGHSVVESGNGRVMAIRTAYKNGKADHYKKHLVEEAETFGIDPKTIEGMKNPILIRERVDKMGDQEKAKFAKEANKATISQMTAVEQASEDSNYLGDLTNLKATESGRITNSNNSQFIKDFFSQVMDNDPREIGKLLNKDGKLNDEGERRLTNAVFVRVYGADSDIMNKLIMKDTDQTKKITAGMLAAAPRMAKFKTTLANNDRHDLDISGNFIDALTAMEDLKRSGVSLEEKLATVDWSELGVSENFKDPLKNKDIVDIIRLIQEHGTGLTGSGKKVASLLTNYADEAEKAIFAEDPNRITIDEAMGVSKEDQIKTTKADILTQAKDEVTFMKADRKGKTSDYESYLEKYPSGKFATEAKEKLKSLEKPPEPGESQVGF